MRLEVFDPDRLALRDASAASVEQGEPDTMGGYSGFDRLVRVGLLATVLAAEACAAGLRGETIEDRAVNARVQASLEQYPSLQAPNDVTVQTRGRVVYLRGLVSTPYQKRLAGSAAAQAAEGLHIVNMIAVDNIH